MNRFQPIKNSGVKCRFCDFLTPTSKHAPEDTPWLIDDSYAAFVSIGALVPGWSLIVPKDHKINLSEDYASEEFWSFVDTAAKTIKNQYGKFSIFEHGAFDFSSQTSCGTGHAHLHIVPISFSLFDAALEFDKALIWEKCLPSEVAEKSKGSEYLFVSDSFDERNSQGQICLLPEETSQFFRKVIATKLGIPENYDYKKNMMIDIARKSFEELSRTVYEHSQNRRSA